MHTHPLDNNTPATNKYVPDQDLLVCGHAMCQTGWTFNNMHCGDSSAVLSRRLARPSLGEPRTVNPIAELRAELACRGGSLVDARGGFEPN